MELQQGNDIAAEVGPLKYMAEITGQPMNKIVNWFALLIIFVFDPLAVTLVIAFNTALKLDGIDKVVNEVKTSHNYKIYGDEPIDAHPHSHEHHPDTEFDPPNEHLKHAAEKYKVFKKMSVLPSVEVGSGVSIGTPITTPPIPTQPEVSDIEDKKKVLTKVDDEIDNLKQDMSKRPIDTDGDGIVDGYDTNGDGLIDNFRPYSSTRWRYAENRKPYYARPDFDWNNRSKWINDQNAVNYWITHIKPNKYPTDFDSKTY